MATKKTPEIPEDLKALSADELVQKLMQEREENEAALEQKEKELTVKSKALNDKDQALATAVDENLKLQQSLEGLQAEAKVKKTVKTVNGKKYVVQVPKVRKATPNGPVTVDLTTLADEDSYLAELIGKGSTLLKELKEEE